MKAVIRNSLFFMTVFWPFIIYFIVGCSIANAALPTPVDTIKGRLRGMVTDKQTLEPVAGANIVLPGTLPQMGTITDDQGRFIFERLPVGTYQVQVSYLGYKTIHTDFITVGSVRETILTFELEPSLSEIAEVTIGHSQRKDKPANDMALVSARSFSIDETSRFPGSYNDPARMVAKYAGVMPARDNRNDIIIRGNSPTGVLWRVDGIEIPNPNHFGATGTTGGPITIINNNLLSNSDFYTGAFPAEFGNTLAGVFDLRMRNGNNQRFEKWAQIGWNGLELGIEGPFRQNSGSFMAAYRYSVTDLLENAGIRLEESSAYQDATIKANFKAGKLGYFSIISLGGKSSISLNDSEKPQDDWTFRQHGEDLTNSAQVGVAGITHYVSLSRRLVLRNVMSAVYSGLTTTIDTFSVSSPNMGFKAYEESSVGKYSHFTKLGWQLSARSKANFGIRMDIHDAGFLDREYFHGHDHFHADTSVVFINGRGFAEFQHDFSEQLSIYTGLSMPVGRFYERQYPEPRFGVKYHKENHLLSLGGGMHSQAMSTVQYFAIDQPVGGSRVYNNLGVEPIKSLHGVAGYEWLLNTWLRFKFEAYYQYLYEVPVDSAVPGYSVLNAGADFYIERVSGLVNEGSGQNYGVECTFEQFLHRNFYYLITGSLFRSRYAGYDGVWRSTAFDGRYALNIVAGYELPFLHNKNVFMLGGLFTWAGGRPYLPFDADATRENSRITYDWERAYSVRRDDYLRGSIRIGMRRNLRRMSMESAFDFQYRSNYTNIYLQRIDVVTGEIFDTYSMGFYPMATLKVNF